MTMTRPKTLALVAFAPPALLVLLVLALGSALAQAPRPDVQRIDRFHGSVRVGGKAVQVAIDTFLIPNDTKLDALDLPLSGQMVVEARGGALFTVIDGQRLPRKAGDFWTVPAGKKMRVETESDSAAIQTTVVAE